MVMKSHSLIIDVIMCLVAVKLEPFYENGTSDFYGCNHYSTKFYSADTYESGMYPIPSSQDDIGAVASFADPPGPVPHTTKVPQGMRIALKWIKDTYNNPPVMITENGYGTLGGINDVDRIDYHREYIHAVLDAIEEDGCSVVAYTAWSLMDNFEWFFGLSAKFGLFEVDFEDEKRPRRAKASALWYRTLAYMKIVPEEVPELKDIVF